MGELTFAVLLTGCDQPLQPDRADSNPDWPRWPPGGSLLDSWMIVVNRDVADGPAYSRWVSESHTDFQLRVDMTSNGETVNTIYDIPVCMYGGTQFCGT